MFKDKAFICRCAGMVVATNPSSATDTSCVKNFFIIISSGHNPKPILCERGVGCYATPLDEGGRNTLRIDVEITAPRLMTWRQLRPLLFSMVSFLRFSSTSRRHNVSCFQYVMDRLRLSDCKITKFLSDKRCTKRRK